MKACISVSVIFPGKIHVLSDTPYVIQEVKPGRTSLQPDA